MGAVHLSITCSPCEVCHIAFIFQHHGKKKKNSFSLPSSQPWLMKLYFDHLIHFILFIDLILLFFSQVYVCAHEFMQAHMRACL